MVGSKEFLLGSIFDGDGGYEVGIVDVEDDQVCMSLVGCYGEAAGLIREESPGYVIKEDVDQVGCHIAWFLEDRIGGIVFGRRSSGR